MLKNLGGFILTMALLASPAVARLRAEGTTLSLNGESLGSIPGDDLARAGCAIWLGANPIDKNFRDLLLGGS